ncbi:LysR family transcriptional regulator [Microbacterium sp. EST19A]|uniref:LysR family transcriptional regulator n=1 Tax=Microbacterium sp. EST19A TaxID=2862681 RepID=UPI001CBB0465|nr:LysR family transcriptional regulator [Microbacterium sp. EST19A]
MQLDLNLLTTLDALLDEQSVTGAAERLHLSEPAVSRTLGRIRKATGDPILVRSGRTMRPTPRALEMHEEVRSLVLRARAVLAPETRLDIADLERTFTIRSHDALTSALAPALVEHVSSVAPGIRFRFLGEVPLDTTDLARGLIDLEIGSAASGPGDIAFDHVADDRLVGLARRGNPMLDADIDLDAYVSVPHVIVSRRGRFEDSVDTALAAAHRRRRVVASLVSTAGALEIVRDTDAVVTVPSAIAGRLIADGALRGFALPVDLPTVPIVLAWPKRFSSDLAHGWLRQLVRDAVLAVVDGRSDGVR